MQVLVLLKMSRMFFPDSCLTLRAGITGKQPQLQGSLAEEESNGFSVLHGNTKAGNQRTGFTWCGANPAIQNSTVLAQVDVCRGSQVPP